MPRKTIGLAILLGLSLVIWLTYRQWPPAPSPEPNGSQRRGPTLFYTGEHLGEIEPCGCAKPQLGGIIQQALMLERRRSSPGLLLEVGNLVGRGGRQQELKFTAFVEAMNHMNYDAAAIGHRDLQLGLEFLREVGRRAQFPFLAANLTDLAGQRPFSEKKEVTVGGHELVVIGLLPKQAERYLAEQGSLEDPVVALQRVLATTQRRPVVIGTFGIEVAERLVDAAGRPCVVIYGKGTLLPEDQPRVRGSGVMLGIGGKGRFLGEYELTSPRGLTISKLRIGGSHAMMKSILGRYQTVLVDEDILGRVPRRPAKIAYAGDATCNSCHAKAHTVWTLSRHAHAMETLRRVKHQLDPECVVCHVTGLDVRGGYTSRTETPALARVSCESCHGPGGKHVKTEQKADILRGSEATCRGCHTVEHDPHFDIKSRWKKIAH